MHSLLKLTWLILSLFPLSIFGQGDSVRYKLVEDLTKKIYRTYVDKELAKKMCDTVNFKSSTHKYDTTLNLDEFAFEISKDLRRVSKDNHIIITPPHYKIDYYEYDYKLKSYNQRQWKRHNRQWERHNKRSRKKFKEFLKKYEKRTKDDMFTYGEIKILPGNVGYIEIKDFRSTSYFKKENKGRIKLESVMHFMRNTNSIIIDFRDNLGGRVNLAGKFCSYFIGIPRSYFITTESYARYDSSGISKELSFQKKWYTSDNITNRLTKSKKIFILTSSRTFSAAELTTYKIKQLVPNASIIGEKTTGGGNGHYGGSTNKYYFAIIPSVKVFDESRSNYSLEAKGITPDILLNADSAFATSYKLALPQNYTPSNSKSKYFKKEKITIVENETIFRKVYPDYVGDYNKILISIQDGRLLMTYDSYSKSVLIPESTDFFVTDEFDYIKFKRDESKLVKEIQLKHKDGYLEKFTRR